jgi:glycerophosphoryl diester phosphodiesterase
MSRRSRIVAAVAAVTCAVIGAAGGCDAMLPRLEEPWAPAGPETLTLSAPPNALTAASAQAAAPPLSDSDAADTMATWAIADRRIALVNQLGMVVGRAAGTTTVQASRGSNMTFTTVRVVPPDDPPIRIVAHRGFMRKFPENTILAVRGSFDQGADAVEVDIRLSADGVPVVMHDVTVDRTTDGRGVVNTLSAAEIVALDACARAVVDLPPCAVPLMSDVLREARGRGGIVLHLYGTYTTEDLEKMLAAVREAGMDRETVFISFDYPVLRTIRQLDPVAALGYLSTRPPASDAITALGRTAALVELQAAAAAPSLTRDYLSAASALKHEVGVWVAWNQDQAKQAVALGFRYIIADVPIDRAALIP